MAMIVKPPYPLPACAIEGFTKSVFLAGSIEMGVAEDWQTKVEKGLADQDVVVFNPRRDDWDSSWVQSIDNPQFRGQVTWELDALSVATVIPMYFDPKTKSPISLLELGLFAVEGPAKSKLIVCCPGAQYSPFGTMISPGFWRKGNVDIVCARYNIQQVNTLDELVAATLERLALRA